MKFDKRAKVPTTRVTYNDVLAALKKPRTGRQLAEKLGVVYGTALRVIAQLDPDFVKHVGFVRQGSRGSLAKLYRAR